MFRITTISLIITLGISSANASEQSFQSWDEACAVAKSIAQEGDLVFTDIPNVIFRNVAASSKTWTSHIGIIFRGDRGEWIVSESKVPLSKEVPLCEFLRNSSEYLFEIKRFHRPLSPVEIGRLHETADSMLHKLYTFGFDFDSDRMFCSKFVYLVYQSIGIRAGKLQTFRELLAENPVSSLTFWKWWFFGRIPWDRRTVTPASQLRDPQFTSVLKGSSVK